MPEAISLNSGWISRSINTSDIDNIKIARNLNDVSSIWGKIADFFCGTNKEEAKKELFKLMHPSTTLDTKLNSLSKLKEMASPAWENNFTQDEGMIKIKDSKGGSLFELPINNLSMNNCDVEHSSYAAIGRVVGLCV